MVNVSKQNDVTQINVVSVEQSGKIIPTNDSSAYYSSLSRAWANKTDGPVDGTEYSAKYYAAEAKTSSNTATEAKNSILNNSGFQAVSADLLGNNTIGICAENIASIQNASTNAQIAANKAVEATEQADYAEQKALEVTAVLAGAANTSLSNLTDNGKAVIRENSAGMAIGMIFPCLAEESYVPEYALPCDATEYSGALFPELWNEFLTSSTPKIVTCTYEEYELEVTEKGCCAKFAIDTINNKFKVPLIKNTLFQGLSDTAPVKGNGLGLGLNTIAGLLYPATATASNLGGYFQTTTSPEIGSSTSRSVRALNTFGVSTDSAKSGILAELSAAANVVTVRWFVVVANTSENQSSCDWTEWVSALAGKLNKDMSNCLKPYLVETYVNGLSWYRIWSDGWCEQGGVVGKTSSSWASATIAFLKSFVDTNYVVACLGNWSDSGRSSCTITAKNISSFTVTYAINNTTQTGWWQACGYIN